MRRRVLLALFLWLAASLPAPSPAAAEKPLSAGEILDHVDDLFRGKSSSGTFSMRVVTEHYTREIKMEAWSRGKDYSLIRILSPRKEKGTATLKAGNNIWNYLPKVKRVIKVPSSMMGGSWMGSHFTNDDLIKESRMADDYTYEITFRGEREGVGVIDLTLTPKPEAAVVWGKVSVTVREADWMPLGLNYYDEEMAPARTMTYADVRELGGRTLPARMRMTPVDKPGEYTEVTYHEIEFDLELGDDLFTLRNLKKPGMM